MKRKSKKIQYEFAPDLQEIAVEISKIMFPWVDVSRIKCFRSYGTSSRRTVARCHSLGKLMQMSLGVSAFYPLEFIAERFDNLKKEDQIKVIIHELMHIPKSFGGGFRHHDFVCDRNIEKCYQEYAMNKNLGNSEKIPAAEEKKSWFWGMNK